MILDRRMSFVALLGIGVSALACMGCAKSPETRPTDGSEEAGGSDIGSGGDPLAGSGGTANGTGGSAAQTTGSGGDRWAAADRASSSTPPIQR